MKFKVNVTDLNAAVDVAKIVTPKPVTSKGGAGFLFVVKGDRCFVYSRDTLCVSRASFGIFEADGEGSFVYPAEYIDSFKYLDGHTCTFEAMALEDDKFLVRYEASNGAKSERMSFNPQLLSTCDEDLTATTTSYDFPSAILRDAIGAARPFMVKSDRGGEDHLKTLQIFDTSRPEYSRGDGNLYASDSTRMIWYWSEAFMGKGISIHGQHLSSLVGFLAKSTDKVTVRVGDHFTFVENAEGHVLGWPKHYKMHPKYAYYSTDSDLYVLLVDRVPLLGALNYVRGELDSSRDTIKLHFDHARSVLRFVISEGSSKAEYTLPVKIKPRVVEEEGKEVVTPWAEASDWAHPVSVNHLMDLVREVRGNQVEIRVIAFQKGSKKVAMLRTIDDFRLDGQGKVVIEATEGSYPCRVTRFMPSKD